MHFPERLENTPFHTTIILPIVYNCINDFLSMNCQRAHEIHK